MVAAPIAVAKDSVKLTDSQWRRGAARHPDATGRAVERPSHLTDGAAGKALFAKLLTERWSRKSNRVLVASCAANRSDCSFGFLLGFFAWAPLFLWHGSCP
jgi:hypothetical protein